jgi:hypothetical protein
VDRQRPGRSHRFAQRSSRQQLHDDPRTAVFLDDIVNLDDSDMVDTRGGPSLFEGQRPRCRVRRRGPRVDQEDLLERDRSMQHLVVGKPNPAHAAAAQE